MKSNSGFILIEMLVTISIIGVITLLIANLMNILSTNYQYEQITAKQYQVSSLMYDDMLSATDVSLVDQCLEIISNRDLIMYCIIEQRLIRTVNNQGYERLISNFEGRFLDEQAIKLEIKIENKRIVLPLWSAQSK